MVTSMQHLLGCAWRVWVETVVHIKLSNQQSVWRPFLVQNSAVKAGRRVARVQNAWLTANPIGGLQDSSISQWIPYRECLQDPIVLTPAERYIEGFPEHVALQPFWLPPCPQGSKALAGKPVMCPRPVAFITVKLPNGSLVLDPSHHLCKNSAVFHSKQP